MLFLRFKASIFSIQVCKVCGLPDFKAFFQCDKSTPNSLKYICFEFAKPITFMSINNVSIRCCCCLAICSMRRCPTFPTPIINKFSVFTCSSKNLLCKMFKALLTSFLAITADIFRSDAPWAMALIFTLFSPKALNILPLIPW